MEPPSDLPKATVKISSTTTKLVDGNSPEGCLCAIGKPPCEPGSERNPNSPDVLEEMIQRILPGWNPNSEPLENTSLDPKKSLDAKPPCGLIDPTKDANWWSRAMGMEPDHHLKVGQLCLAAGAFLSAAIRNDRRGATWMVIHGPFGTGKSHVMRWVIRAFNDWIWDFMLDQKTSWNSSRKPLAESVNWSKFVRQEEHENGNISLVDLRSVDVLAIDDVGAESDRYRGGANLSLLRDLLEDSRQKWLMLSTNVVRGSWAQVFGPRVTDRLSAAAFVDLTGVPSYRPKLKRVRA